MPELKNPFRSTKRLQIEIEEFLDKVAEGVMVFEQAALHYLEHGYGDPIERMYEQIARLERRGDELRRGVELTLYTEMLIPEARGDVLGLLDDLDHLLDRMKKQLLGLVIEQPTIPKAFVADVQELVSAVAKCLEVTVLAARTYFREPGAVRDHIHKIGFHESESDEVCIRLRRAIAASDLKLQQKMALRDGAMAIDELADEAEDAGDRLAIYAVKRSL